MKYGVLSAADWDVREEGWPDGSVCIVALNDDGTLFIDPIVRTKRAIDVGVGQVHGDDGHIFGFVQLPLDVTVHGVFQLQNDAFQYARSLINDTQALNDNVTAQIAENRFWDDLVDDLQETSRYTKWSSLILCMVFVIIIFALLYWLKLQGYHIWPMF